MRREPGSVVKESSRNYPESVLALPHHVLLSPYPELHRKPGCRLLARLWAEALAADGNGGVSQRIEYGSVGCVLPAASKGLSPSCRAGIVFGGYRRLGLPGFCKVSPRRMAAHPCPLCSPSHRAALRLSSPPSVSPPRARIALGCRRGANAGARLCQYQCQPCAEHLFRRHVRRIWFIQPRRRSAPLSSAATPRAAAACGARGS